MYKTVKEYLEAESKKIYTSATAEYKRKISKTTNKIILKSPEEVWNKIISDLIKDENEKVNIYNGMRLSFGKINVFIVELIKQKLITIGFTKKGSDTKDQFIRISYKLKSLPNGFTKLYYTESAKRATTIVGMNGKLGSIKYNWAIKNKAIEVFKKISA